MNLRLGPWRHYIGPTPRTAPWRASARSADRSVPTAGEQNRLPAGGRLVSGRHRPGVLCCAVGGASGPRVRRGRDVGPGSRGSPPLLSWERLRRGGRAVECGGLENRRAQAPWVRIPPSPPRWCPRRQARPSREAQSSGSIGRTTRRSPHGHNTPSRALLRRAAGASDPPGSRVRWLLPLQPVVEPLAVQAELPTDAGQGPVWDLPLPEWYRNRHMAGPRVAGFDGDPVAAAGTSTARRLKAVAKEGANDVVAADRRRAMTPATPCWRRLRATGRRVRGG